MTLRKMRSPFLSPGYIDQKGNYIFTGCRDHDKDPCPECEDDNEDMD